MYRTSTSPTGAGTGVPAASDRSSTPASSDNPANNDLGHSRQLEPIRSRLVAHGEEEGDRVGGQPAYREHQVTEYNGAAVHMAVGVLMERHNCDAAQAMAMLSSAAFTAGRNIGALAVEIVDGARHGVTDD